MTIGFNSPYITVIPGTLRNHDYGDEISVVSFEIKTDEKILSGEYSFFLTNKANNTDFAVGSLTVEQIENSWESYVRLTTE